MKQAETIDFNTEAVKKMSKKDFVEQHKDHPAAIDWAAQYDEITKSEEKPVKEAARTEKDK